MWQARSAFGVAIYPNFSQIFVAGGSTNQSEATKHCERYIVDQNIWKRLPELKEAKFSVSLCFFNNGSTLYCFGGLQKTGPNQFMPTSTIERLSKGQNSWQILNLRLPEASFDIGSMQINQNEILLFGGFSDAPIQKVWTYTHESSNAEGEFNKAADLQKEDFFVQNGVYIDLPLDKCENNEQERVIVGNHHMHLLNLNRKTFRALETK